MTDDSQKSNGTMKATWQYDNIPDVINSSFFISMSAKIKAIKSKPKCGSSYFYYNVHVCLFWNNYIYVTNNKLFWFKVTFYGKSFCICSANTQHCMHKWKKHLVFFLFSDHTVILVVRSNLERLIFALKNKRKS